MKTRLLAVASAFAVAAATTGMSVDPVEPASAGAVAATAVGATDPAADNLELQALDITFDTVELDATARLHADDEIAYDLALDVATSEATVHVTSDVAELDGQTLTLDVHELTADRVLFTATDAETGQSAVYDSSQGTLSAIPLLLALPALGAVMKAFLLATGATIVILGITYVVAERAIPAIREQIRKNSATKRHYAVVLRNGKVYFGAGLSLSQAATHFRSGGNTWSASKDGARQVAQSARSGLRPVGPEKDKSGSGKYCHYHGNNRKPEGIHAFYGVAGQGTC